MRCLKIGRLGVTPLIEYKSKIIYQAKAVMLLHNDFGSRGESSELYWELADMGAPDATRKMPIVEFNVAKNKFNSYKGVQFMEFIPEMAHMRPVDEADRDFYMQKLSG